MNATNQDTRRLAHASMTSGVGAGMLGISVGLLFHDALLAYFTAILLIGLVLHSLGMYEKHRIENQHETRPSWWMRALYAACWIGLAALAAFVAIRGLER